ncbi:Rv3654c family TadE-like protein [Streptomyces sp. NPDC004732]|uniref:Rv3654c family TadE-like protein n=1 Tax=Streptomyces sp. NPDC004732 TaxID=3154290 RepID=UPI0033B94CCF
MRAAGWRGAGRDRGAATVWVVVAMAVLGVICGAVLAMTQVVVARHRAGGAADLAALAAADRWPTGSTEACAGAVRVAEAQGARVLRCAVRGELSEVTAASSAGPFTATVSARAGPATSRVALRRPAEVGAQARRFAADVPHPRPGRPRAVRQR